MSLQYVYIYIHRSGICIDRQSSVTWEPLEKVREPQVEQFIHHSATSNLRSQVPVSVELSTTPKSSRLLHPFHLCCTFNSCLKGLATVDSIDVTDARMQRQGVMNAPSSLATVKLCWCCRSLSYQAQASRRWKSQIMMKIWQEMRRYLGRYQIYFECNGVSSYHDIMNHHR